LAAAGQYSYSYCYWSAVIQLPQANIAIELTAKVDIIVVVSCQPIQHGVSIKKLKIKGFNIDRQVLVQPCLDQELAIC
jgi:hypothetical protein